jgi:hypothetical protein
MARKKTSFYHLRKKIGLNDQSTADVLGVSIEEVQRWTLEGAPPMAERLLCLWDSKHVGIEGWQGFQFIRGALVFRGRRWRPEMLLRWSENAEALADLERELQRLKTWRGLSTVFVDKLVSLCRRRYSRRGF